MTEATVSAAASQLAESTRQIAAALEDLRERRAERLADQASEQIRTATALFESHTRDCDRRQDAILRRFDVGDEDRKLLRLDLTEDRKLLRLDLTEGLKEVRGVIWKAMSIVLSAVVAIGVAWLIHRLGWR